MLQTVIATKLGMSQAWTNAGKRVAVTRCRIDNNIVVSQQAATDTQIAFEVGFGDRKQKNMSKPLQGKLTKGGFSVGVRGLKSIKLALANGEADVKVGDTIKVENVLAVGDIVQVQGTSKGRGFAGAMKRHGFHGGQKTHGQSDRARAVGSIGAGTYPGHVWKGKKMPGHYGVETRSVKGLIVLHVDPLTQEVWLSGPVPGHMAGFVTITKTGKTKAIALDKNASGIIEPVVVAEPEVAAEVVETPAAETTEGQN